MRVGVKVGEGVNEEATLGEGGEVKGWGRSGGGDVRLTQQGQNTAIHWSSKHKYMMQLASCEATADLNP